MIYQGATEKDLVYSGLEDTVCKGLDEVVRTARDKNVSYRTAAFVNAFNKMHGTYNAEGLMKICESLKSSSIASLKYAASLHLPKMAGGAGGREGCGA